MDGELIRYVEHCFQSCGNVQCLITVSEANYRAAANGGKLVRLRLRFCMYIWHALRLVVKMLTCPKDSIWIVTSNPFFAPGLAAVVGRIRKQPVIQLLYDLFPDALEEAGLIRRDGFRARLLGTFTKLALKKSNATVFLGQRLQAHAEARWGKAPRAYVIPVVLSMPQCSDPSIVNTGRVEIHYGGQLGWMHDAKRLAELVGQFQSETDPVLKDKLHWSFLISGAHARWFRECMDSTGVELGGTLSVKEWRARAMNAEVGLVTLSEGGARVCLPSKAYGMMACGMAILALCPKDSDLGQLIELSEAGWVVDSSEAEPERLQQAFNQTVRRIIENPEERLQRRRNALNLVQAENLKDTESLRWTEIIENI